MEMEARVSVLEKRVEENDDAHKDIIRRLNAKDVSDAIIGQKLDTLVLTTNRIEKTVNEQQAKPAKRYELIITTIITTLVGVIVGGIIGLIIK